jgi:hypothetical protein
MSSKFIVCRFHLNIDFPKGGPFDWYCRPAELAVFHFGRQVSDVEVCQRMGRVGFKPADELCHIHAYQARQAFPIVASGTLVAPAVKIGRRMSDGKWCWQTYQRFLGVRWLGNSQKYKYPFRAIFPSCRRVEEFDNRPLVV